MRAVWLLVPGAGVLQGLALAWPDSGAPMWCLSIGTLSVLAWALLVARSWRQAAMLAFAFFWGYMGAAIWWLFVSLNTYGAIPAPLALLAVGLFCALLALLYSVVLVCCYCGFYCRVPAWLAHQQQHKPLPTHGLVATIADKPARAGFAFALVFASGITLAELLRAVLFTGFPWGSVGYSQIDGVLAHFAPWTGVYGVGWLMAWAAALLGVCFALWRQTYMRIQAQSSTQSNTQYTTHRRWCLAIQTSKTCFGNGWLALLLGLLALGIIALALPPSAVRKTPTTSIALLQGNVDQAEKFDNPASVDAALQWYVNALWQSPASLTITPETAVPLPQTRLSDRVWSTLALHLVQQGRAALVGIPYALRNTTSTNSKANDSQYRYSNAALAFGASLGLDNPPQNTRKGFIWDRLWRYDKHHLVPFGEFVPPFFQWFVKAMQIPFSNFAAGPADARSLQWNGNRFAVTVCYEDLFSAELALRFRNPEAAPTVLVNISNLAWFGNANTWSTAIDQHLQIARMRSLEFARPTLRATNTGATAIIDSHGQVQATLPYNTRGVLSGQVHGTTGNTWYATWASRWGLWPLWIGAVLMLGLGAGWMRRTI